MCWWKIGVVAAAARTGNTAKDDPGSSTINSTRKRLIRISFMSCTCLLMNTVATISVSTVLDDWSYSSGIWLTCTVSEETFTRNWENYGFYKGDSPPNYEVAIAGTENEFDTPEIQQQRTDQLKTACSQEKSVGVVGACVSDCFW